MTFQVHADGGLDDRRGLQSLREPAREGEIQRRELGGGDGATWEFRSKLQGLVDWGAEPDQPEDRDTVAPTNADTVAPTIAIASARPAKLRRPAGATRSRSRWHSATTSRGTPSRTC